MVQYSADGKTAVYGGYKFRQDPKSGYYLCTRKTDIGRRERLHMFVWRSQNGPIPKGYHIHHKDGDKRNNDLDNLVCISGHAHLSLHSNAQVQANYSRLVQNLKENAIPKAAEWHRSPEGREWHSKHGKEVSDNLQPVERVCQYCGKHYFVKPFGQSKFCSNNCKTRARYASGVDQETRTCAHCGKEFQVNKYARTKYCSRSCGRQAYWDKKHKTAG